MNFREILKDYQALLIGLIVSASIIASVVLFTGGVVKYQKLQNQTITTTGSASKEINADYAIVTIGYRAQAATLKEGYRKMEESKTKLKKFLVEAHFGSDNIESEQISSYEVYKRYGNYTSNEVEFYRLNSDIKVKVWRVEMVEDIKKQLSSLVIDDGIDIAYSNIEYFVKDLDDIKIEMVGEATKNAKYRAEAMVGATGGKLGPLTSAKTGVFQIVPANSTDVSDYGINDTTSPNKKIIAVVNATFGVK